MVRYSTVSFVLASLCLLGGRSDRVPSSAKRQASSKPATPEQAAARLPAELTPADHDHKYRYAIVAKTTQSLGPGKRIMNIDGYALSNEGKVAYLAVVTPDGGSRVEQKAVVVDGKIVFQDGPLTGGRREPMIKDLLGIAPSGEAFFTVERNPPDPKMRGVEIRGSRGTILFSPGQSVDGCEIDSIDGIKFSPVLGDVAFVGSGHFPAPRDPARTTDGGQPEMVSGWAVFTSKARVFDLIPTRRDPFVADGIEIQHLNIPATLQYQDRVYFWGSPGSPSQDEYVIAVGASGNRIVAKPKLPGGLWGGWRASARGEAFWAVPQGVVRNGATIVRANQRIGNFTLGTSFEGPTPTLGQTFFVSDFTLPLAKRSLMPSGHRETSDLHARGVFSPTGAAITEAQRFVQSRGYVVDFQNDLKFVANDQGQVLKRVTLENPYDGQAAPVEVLLLATPNASPLRPARARLP